MHLEPTDQPGDAADDRADQQANRCKSLNRRLGSYLRKDLPHAAKSRGSVRRWPGQHPAQLRSGRTGREGRVRGAKQVLPRRLAVRRDGYAHVMLDGRPAVFLSCSEGFKERVAWPIRAALQEEGIHGVIVSDEPLLPRASTDPDGKVNSYLDASDAVVALCTPDDELSDGTIQCRQNVIDEIQRARGRPGLSGRIQILKAPSVRLPSNINPTYDRLDVDDLSAAVEVITRQLRAWEVLARSPEPALSVSTEPVSVDDLIDGVHLGDHDEAGRRSYQLLAIESRESQRAVVDRLIRFIITTPSTGGDEVHRASSVLEAINRLDSSLISTDAIERLARSPDFTARSCAAYLLWDRAEVAPNEVPLGLLGRLARPAREDWYVQAPAMAAAKLLLLKRRTARVIFDSLAESDDSDERYAVAAALRDVARVDPTVIPRDLVEKLCTDQHELVAAEARKVLAVRGIREENERDPRNPFGI